MKNIILIGFMGAGKTVVGKKLAEELGFCFKDTDQLIEVQTGQTISRLFESRGEAYFRTLEKQVVESLAGCQGNVIATGGGMIMDPDNRQILQTLGPLIHLAVSADAILQRVGLSNDRPLLRGENPRRRIEELLAQRRPVYAQADWVIDTTALPVAEVVRQILTFLEANPCKR